MLYLSQETITQLRTDLGINLYKEKGSEIPVKRCWHYSTDGRSVNQIFYDDDDFTDGMNRIYIVLKKYHVTILAFVLMDNHMHFILHGDKEDCDRFIREYLRRTAMSISKRHHEPHPLAGLPVSCQKIDDQRYLKTAICYVLKNPTKAGLEFIYCDYPWSSGPLYFRDHGKTKWSSPLWSCGGIDDSLCNTLVYREKRAWLKSHEVVIENTGVCDELIFPGEYVAAGIVEELFRTARNFSYFIGRNSEDVEMRSETLALLTIPWKELRAHRDTLCIEMFNTRSFRHLDTASRLQLGKAICAKYNCSKKQVSKLVGLVYNEVKDIL